MCRPHEMGPGMVTVYRWWPWDGDHVNQYSDNQWYILIKCVYIYIYIFWSYHITTKWYILNIFDMIKIGLGEKLWYLGWTWLIPTWDVHLLIIIALTDRRIEGHTHTYINIYIYIKGLRPLPPTPGSVASGGERGVELWISDRVYI